MAYGLAQFHSKKGNKGGSERGKGFLEAREVDLTSSQSPPPPPFLWEIRGEGDNLSPPESLKFALPEKNGFFTLKINFF